LIPLKSLGEPDERAASLIYRGAEADVYAAPWCGRQAIFKIRKKLPYRLDILDESIRSQRTVHEAEMLHRSKLAGVASPLLYFVDTVNSTIVMEFVEGSRMKDLVGSKEDASPAVLFEMLGRTVASLHSSGIMHGDLTTSNVIVSNGRLVMIDFGLSIITRRLEDQAVDLRLIKETLTGAHSEVADEALEALFEGYGEVVGAAGLRAVLRQLRDVERRGRYARVE
jgi:TP53 regulating kinase-like protein